MGKICTVAIHKGGTGKTTVSAHLAFLAAEQGSRTLLIDLDSQGNASDTVLLEVPNLDGVRTASNLFEECEPAKPILNARPKLDVLPADSRLLAVERLDFEAATLFSQRLKTLAADYDLVVIDTPPTMGFAMLAPLLTSDSAFAPIVPDAYSLKGIEILLTRVAEIRESHNPGLIFLGLLVNKWRRNSRAQNDTVEQFRQELGDYMIPHTLPEAAAIADAAHAHEPVWKNAKSGSQRKAGKAVREALLWVLNQTTPNAQEATP
jgi:chromosome partitioning protein